MQCMRAVSGRIKPNLPHPTADDPSVLARREVWRPSTQPTGEQEGLGAKTGLVDPRRHGFSGLFCNLELDGPTSLLLHEDGPAYHPVPVRDIPDTELYEIAGPELAIDSEVEQSELPGPLGELQADADRPDPRCP